MTAKRAAATQGSREGDRAASDHPLRAMRESRNEPQTVDDAGPLYVQATAMTYAAIVMSQVAAGLAWRTNRRSNVDVGLLSN
jgi:hypothetical protein